MKPQIDRFVKTGQLRVDAADRKPQAPGDCTAAASGTTRGSWSPRHAPAHCSHVSVQLLRRSPQEAQRDVSRLQLHATECASVLTSRPSVRDKCAFLVPLQRFCTPIGDTPAAAQLTYFVFTRRSERGCHHQSSTLGPRDLRPAAPTAGVQALHPSVPGRERLGDAGSRGSAA